MVHVLFRWINVLFLFLPTLCWGVDAGTDFSNRCNAAGVLQCHGFDTTATDITPYVTADGGSTLRATRDTAIKASGAGSLRFEFPPSPHSGQNIVGQYARGFGQDFGQNSTFYAQIRVRFSESMLANSWDSNSGWKFLEFVRSASVCGNLALVFKIWYNSTDYSQTIPIGYTECGARGLYTNNGVPPYLLQQKGSESGFNCSYGNVNETDCFYFRPNEWLTFYWKVSLGTFGDGNSTIEAWVAREGATSWSKWISLTNFTLNSDGAGSSAAFNTLILTGYMTGLPASGVGSGDATKWSFTWYDEWILSTQPIAIPSANRIATNLPDTLGWHSLSNTAIWNGTPDLCACENGFPTVCGASSCQGVYGYSGGVYDTTRTRLYIFGGGHADYYGNEIYSTSLASGTPTSTRLTDPNLPVAPSTCSDPTTDCSSDGMFGSMITNGTGATPNSRHTYDSIEYDIGNDSMIVIGGSLSSAIGYGGLQEAAGDMWKFSFATNSWTRLTLDGTGDNPFSYLTGAEVFHLADAMGYDNENNCGYYHNRYRLYSFKVTGSSIKFDQLTASDTSLQFSFHQSGAVDPENRRFYMLGDGGYGYYDISGVAADCSYGGAALSFNTLSFTLPPSADTNMNNPGLQWYAPLQKMLAWVGNDIVYYDTGKTQWQKLRVGKNVVSPPSSSSPYTGYATFGRFQCDEDIGGCIMAYYPTTDHYYIRLSAFGTAGEIVPPPPPDPILTFPGIFGKGSLTGKGVLQ